MSSCSVRHTRRTVTLAEQIAGTCHLEYRDEGSEESHAERCTNTYYNKIHGIYFRTHIHTACGASFYMNTLDEENML